jgi:hypothetical protein
MQSEKKDIRKKFGLDYLTIPASEVAELSERPSDVGNLFDKQMERALVAVGGKILSILKDAPDKSARLYELVDATGIELETLFRVVERIERLEFVKYAERDKHGNHKIQLTQIGEKSLS